jgi:hypothetical protein
MQPHVRRTWSPRGKTPELRQRTGRRSRLSVIGGLSLSPRRRRPGWHLLFHLNRAVRQGQVVEFLRALLRQIRGNVVVIWDRLPAHRGGAVRRWAAAHPRLILEPLPPYAPELNPVEYGWSHWKQHELCGYCPDDDIELMTVALVTAERVAARPTLLRSFVRAAPLPLRL